MALLEKSLISVKRDSLLSGIKFKVKGDEEVTSIQTEERKVSNSLAETRKLFEQAKYSTDCRPSSSKAVFLPLILCPIS